MAVAASILGDSLLYAVLPTIFPELGLQAAMVGVLLSANRFIRLASNPVASWVVGRVGVRGPFVVAVFVSALTTASYAFGLGFTVFLLARAAWGICWSFLRLGGYLAALESSTDENRGYYLGFFNGVARFGSFIAALIGGFLTDLIGFETTVYAFAGVTLLGGLAVLRERPPAGREGSRVLTRMPAADPVDATAIPEALHTRLAVVFGSGFIHAMILQGLVTATLGFWLQDQYGDNINLAIVTVGVATLNGFMLSSLFLSDFLWGPISGHLSDRHGRVRLLLIAGLLEVVALVGLALTLSIWWTILVGIGLFLAGTSVKVTLDALSGDLAPVHRRAQTMSWYATASDLGAAAGPLIGWLVGTGLGLGWLYAGAAGLLAGVGLVYLAVFGFSARSTSLEYVVNQEPSD